MIVDLGDEPVGHLPSRAITFQCYYLRSRLRLSRLGRDLYPAIADLSAKVAILHYIIDRQVFIVMGLIQLLLLLGLGVGTAGLVSNSNRRKRLESAFYQLLRQQGSCISLIQLMAISQVDTQTAKQFLDEQVRLLDGIPEVDEDGDTFYRFPKLRLPDPIAHDDW
jgi:hypothetical protein